MQMIEGLSVELRYRHKGWTLYLFRNDGLGGLPVADSENLPGIHGPQVANQWISFLGLTTYDISGNK